MCWMLYICLVQMIKQNVNLILMSFFQLKHVSITGGANVAEATRRMMGSLISNKLATQFHWQGKGEKRGFSKLLLSDIGYSSVICIKI